MEKRQFGSWTYRTFEIIDASYFYFSQSTHKSSTFHKLQIREKHVNFMDICFNIFCIIKTPNK